MENENPNPENEPIRMPDAPEENPNIVISQATIYYFLTAIMFFVAGLIVGWVGSSSSMSGTINEIRSLMVTVQAQVAAIPAGGGNQAVAIQPTDTPIPRQTIDSSYGPSWGPADAKVTIVEFSDFQCPYCEQYFQDTYPLLKNTYGNKIHYVYRYYPLPMHPQAMPAALAATCANEQGKFWEFHDVVFNNQNDLSDAALTKDATLAGVANTTQFTQCYTSQKYQSTIQKDMSAGDGYYVTGTPTFFINGVYVPGAQPYAVFRQVIEGAWCEADPTHEGCSSSTTAPTSMLLSTATLANGATMAPTSMMMPTATMSNSGTTAPTSMMMPTMIPPTATSMMMMPTATPSN